MIWVTVRLNPKGFNFVEECLLVRFLVRHSSLNIPFVFFNDTNWRFCLLDSDNIYEICSTINNRFWGSKIISNGR